MLNNLLIKNPKNIAPIPSGAEFYVLKKIFEEVSSSVVFLARDSLKAKEVYDSLKYFLPENVSYFPVWDIQPYDLLSPSSAILHKRTSELNKLIHNSTSKIIITSYEAIIQKIIPQDFLIRHGITLSIEQVISREKIINFLIENGYHKATTVNEPGEFAVRGSIIDIYANGYKFGHRLDFFGDKIEQIKTFDPITQITKAKQTSFKIIPPSEIILTSETKQNFKDKLIANFGTKAINMPNFQKIEHSIRPIGIEQWYPLFYTKLNSLFDYIKEGVFVFDFLSLNQLFHYFDIIEENYNYRKTTTFNANHNYVLPPEELYLTKEQLKQQLNNKTIIFNESGEIESRNSNVIKLGNLEVIARTKKLTIFQYITELLKNKKPVIISAISEGSKERIKKILLDHNIQLADTVFNSHTKNLKNGICIAPFTHGFKTEDFILITEHDIFGERIKSSRTRKNKQIKNLIEQAYNFSPGELIVHKEHGIGRFIDLETITVQGIKHDCLKLQYAGEDKLFLPVENIEQISKYGLEGDVKLDKLGSVSWQARKAKVKNKIKLSAQYLINLAAERLIKKTEILEPNIGLFEEFCASFPYVETEDQLRAVEEIKEDLKKDQPMDRLICGDVGFGKTEVALRAAFLAVTANSKNQVVLFCPTTLLCKQHYKLFKERLSKFGIKVKQISRLVNRAEINKTINEINEGKIDIIIGTHALLNKKIKFYNLTLLIVDEEQHFGVAQKEKLKELKSNVHVLTLSATPIPRTLQMSLSGVKDLSLIATPPVNRLVTKTSVLTLDPAIIKEALLREYYRGGQSFYVVPRITDLTDIEELLKEITPELKYIIAHGQMPPGRLDQIMNEFYEGKYDVLLSTTIIESGLDVPKANTLIVHKSDKFGLSQLYQLRGRVGRSNIPAYAYFTLPISKRLKADTIKRLEILQNIDSLGAGFAVATHDMDTRGFGNLIGEEQSGHVREVGIELYQDLLQEEIKKIKNNTCEEDIEAKEILPQINLAVSALIPEDYINDIDIRLGLYRRVALIRDNKEIEEFAAEIIDRFGSIPEEFENLISLIKLKNLCFKAKVTKIDVGPKAILFKLNDKQLTNPEKILNFIMSNPRNIKLRSNNEILLFINELEQKSNFQRISDFLNKLIAQY